MRPLLLAGLLAVGACAAAGQTQSSRPKAPPPPDSTDLVSALSAAGLDHAQGLGLPRERAAAPSTSVFENATLLGGLPAERLMTAMQSMRYSLGVDCGHCHDDDSFAKDDKQPKKTARAMMKMALDIDTRFFGGKTYVTCYTCHRQDSTPDPFVAAKPVPEWPMPPLSDEEAAKPAKALYKNLLVLGDMPAGRLAETMQKFSSSLGTGCVHCHAPGDWASDEKPAKKRAREMLGMVRDVDARFFAEAKTQVSCGTCHRGDVRPARNAGPSLRVGAALAGGAAAPALVIALGPPDFKPSTRKQAHDTLQKDADKFVLVRFEQSLIGELGHVAPGSYSMCALALPEDPDPKHDPKGWERPVVCEPVTVAAEPEVQTVTIAPAPI